MAKEKIKPRVALVSMPVLAAHLPSVQLGLLKPTLQREGIDVQTFSLYMYFGNFIGFAINEALSDVRPCIASEWVWSKAAFGDFSREQEYIDYYLADLQAICAQAECTMADLLLIRHEKTFSFIQFCLEQVDWSRFQIIGFSVVFQQMAASIALARALKEKVPHIPIIFGGGAFEDDIAASIMKGCSFIDYILCGDADTAFPEMIHKLDAGESLEGVAGLMWRQNNEILYKGRAPALEDIDHTPVPDYDEYFYAYHESGYNAATFAGKKAPFIPIETARGCWWGEKNHCTFCGLNRAGLSFRCKKPQTVLNMLQTLSRKYNYLYFEAIDNIMSPDYIEAVFGTLADNRSDLLIHYEVRPNLSRTQLARLRRGGLFSLQPGVESFSTHVLQLMRKHILGIRNVEFVKWCTYYGIIDLYNILYGFSGETATDYELQCQLMAKIPHFQPPYAITRARPERGSPMYLNQPDFFIQNMEPSYCYHHIYPADTFDLNQVSYYFMHRVGNIPATEHYSRIISMVATWKNRWESDYRPRLCYRKTIHTVHVEDTRGETRSWYVYYDRDAELFEFLMDSHDLETIIQRFDGQKEWVLQKLADFMEKDLVLFMDDRYLNLVLPVNPNI